MEPPNTFIIRFWWKPPDEGAPPAQRWYAQIEHLQSGARAGFLDASQLLEFIERFVSPLDLPDEMPAVEQEK